MDNVPIDEATVEDYLDYKADKRDFQYNNLLFEMNTLQRAIMQEVSGRKWLKIIATWEALLQAPIKTKHHDLKETK